MFMTHSTRINESCFNKKELLNVLNSKFSMNGKQFLKLSLNPDRKFDNEFIGSYKVQKITEQDLTISCSKDLSLVLGFKPFAQIQKEEILTNIENIKIEEGDTYIINCLCTVSHIR